MISCNDCGRDVDPLEEFPQRRCLDCHAKAPEVIGALAVMTSGGLARMWGAK